MIHLCITYDFISTKPSRGLITQSKKLDLIGSVLEKLSFGVDFSLIDFSYEKFLKLIDFQKTENIYDHITLAILPLEALAYLNSVLQKYDYIIGYELSKNTREILESLGVKYIDIWLSPIRFHKDILFEFYSNDKFITKRLPQYRLNDNKLFKSADKISQYCKNFLDYPNLEENSCLLIGQMNQDKSVMKDSHFLTLIDFMQNLETLSKEYKKLYLLKHPLMQASDFENLANKLFKFKNLEVLTGINTYHLLSMQEISCVAGISSSVLIEAPYFKKRVELFYKPIIEENYTRIYKHFLTSSFWETLFNIKGTKEVACFTSDNHLRIQYDAIYSYGIFLPVDFNKHLEDRLQYNILVSFYNSLNLLNQNDKYILYGFGSIGRLIYPHIKDKVVAIADKVLSLSTTSFDGKPIISKENIDAFEYDKIIISPFKYNNEISLELKKYKSKLLYMKDLK